MNVHSCLNRQEYSPPIKLIFFRDPTSQWFEYLEMVRNLTEKFSSTEKNTEQAGAELCQAQDKLRYIPKCLNGLSSWVSSFISWLSGWLSWFSGWLNWLRD